MRKLLIARCTLLSLIVGASSLYANADQDAAENVFRRAQTSISRIEEGKIFLKPEKLHLEHGVIYVEDIDGAAFAIPAVFSTEGRPYVQVGDSVIFNSWKCDCGTWNHKWDNPTHCWNCGRPR